MRKYVDDGLSTKQATIDSTHKLSADLVDDTSTTNKFFSGNYNDLSNKPTIPDELADLSDDSTHRVVTDTEKSTWSGKQDALVSGTNIKTINSTSLLGSGDIEVGADIPQQDTAPSNPQEDDLWIDTDDNTSLVVIDSTVSTTSTNPVQNQAITNYVNSLTTSTEWINIAANNWHCKYKKMGNVVCIKGYSPANTTIAGYAQTVVGGLPDASLRPTETVRSLPYARGNNNIYLQVASDTNNIIIFNWGSAVTYTDSGQVAFTITYII